MRVLHISSAKSIRGGEYQISLLIKHLAGLGIKNFLLCPSDSELSKEKLDGLHKLITYVKLSPANLLVSAFIKKLVVSEHIDLLHMHDPHSHQFAFYSYKLFGNQKPAVVTRRVSFPVKKTSKSYYSHPKVKKVICVSKSVLDSLDNLSLDAEKRVVIHSGIPLELKTNGLNIRRKYKIPSDTKIVANLAALSPQKDYITFVKTAKEFIDNSRFSVKIMIVGADGGTKENVVQLVEKLGLADHFIFTGYVSNADQLLSEIDVLLSTSVSEGLGNTIMEAMKYRVPIVATNCEGTIDLVRHMESAMLADIGDYKMLAEHLNNILSDDQLASRLAQAAFEQIEQYDIRTTTKQTLALYQSIVAVQ